MCLCVCVLTRAPKSSADVMAHMEDAADESGTAQLVCSDISHTSHTGQSLRVNVCARVYVHVCALFFAYVRASSHLCVQHLLCRCTIVNAHACVHR